MTKIRLAAVITALAVLCPAMAGPTPDRDTDALFEHARALAFSGEREEARALCREILAIRPEHVDAAVLLGRLHAWDGHYARAREILSRAVAEHPEYTDARLALVDVDLWAERPAAALEQADAGLDREPDHTGLLQRKARALESLGRTNEAVEVAKRSYSIEPDPAVRRYYRGLLDVALRNEVDFEFEVESFDDDTDTWRWASTSYRRTFGFGEAIARVNWADRFGESGLQFEVDAYPRIRPKTYLYANVGVSGSDPFPDLRYGAEVFQGFRETWEWSAGFRRLDFDAADVTILTGSVSKYWRRYWFSARPYWVDHENGTSHSLALSARRYFLGRYEYAELSAAFGNGDSDDPAVAAITSREVQNLDSFLLRGEIRRRVRDTVLLRGFAGIRSEDLPFGRSRNSWFVGAGVAKFF